MLPTLFQVLLVVAVVVLRAPPVTAVLNYPVLDTNQAKFYGAAEELANTPSSEADNFYGQDAQFTINAPSFTDNGDGTISDSNTGLMWTQEYWGRIKRDAADASTITLGGYTDWRIPNIYELYSLIDFSGLDISGEDDTADTSGFTPFINTNFFTFAYGGDDDTRLIDVQFISTADYISAMDSTLPDWFGVNFADGRIKGYSTTFANFFIRYVRGNTNYGVTSFTDNGDETISEANTGLMWEKADSGSGMVWQDALSHCTSRTTGGHTDWRLPAAKELHSIIDYTRSPDATSSAAINAIFTTSSITNEKSETDYPYFWSSTTHKSSSGIEGAAAVYFSFGRAMGYFNSEWQDVHGAGSQKSDPKTGDPNDYPEGNGPQGDAIRINNYVRCVRTETSGVFGGPPTNAPTNAPTPSPTAAPTPSPTASPTAALSASPTTAPTSCGCFSSEMTVEVLGKGPVAMKDLKVGDVVETVGSGEEKWQKIYGFGHWHESVATDYLQIFVEGSDNEPELEISGNHLIFLNNDAHPVRAATIKPGDQIKLQTESKTESRLAVVSNVVAVPREGAYLPLTADGTIVINGVVASTYASIYGDAPVVVDTFQSMIVSEQRLFHWWLAPYRLMCQSQYGNLCEAGRFTDEEGILLWLVWGQKLARFGEKQFLVVRWIGILLVVGILMLFACAEYLVNNPITGMLLIVLGLCVWAKATRKFIRKIH